MSLRIIIPYLLACYVFFDCKWVEGYRKLSKEEDLEIEEQLKRLNKPAVKTVKTRYGDIYDCVNFLEQPSFDHSLLKNHNFHPEMFEKKVPKLDDKEVSIGLEGGGCPIGTVPIRRTTKDDLIRAKVYSDMHASKISPLADGPGTYYAVARTKENINYEGIGAGLSIWNLSVQASQYTSGRIKIRNGDESIEAGWTVNPGLYGDGLTRTYIYTNAKDSHCFNEQCGYLHSRPDIPLGSAITPVSKLGGEVRQIIVSIVRDINNTNNWVLRWGDPPVDLGFWPNQIFTNLGNTATQAEWGGEVFSPPDIPSPGMGSGVDPRRDSNYDAFCAGVHIVLNNAKINPPDDLELVDDRKHHYYIYNAQDVGGNAHYLITYGGPGGVTGT